MKKNKASVLSLMCFLVCYLVINTIYAGVFPLGVVIVLYGLFLVMMRVFKQRMSLNWWKRALVLSAVLFVAVFFWFLPKYSYDQAVELLVEEGLATSADVGLTEARSYAISYCEEDHFYFYRHRNYAIVFYEDGVYTGYIVDPYSGTWFEFSHATVMAMVSADE